MIEIKVKTFEGLPLPEIIRKGDWIDLCVAEDYKFKAPLCKALVYKTEGGKKVGSREIEFESGFLRLGVAMQLPEGYEAIVAPRSSAYKKYGIIAPHSIGVIDNCYNGNNDEWKMPYVALKEGSIKKHERVAQFRIQLSQKATFMQKLKWLFSSKIKLTLVSELYNEDRGGFGEGTAYLDKK